MVILRYPRWSWDLPLASAEFGWDAPSLRRPPPSFPVTTCRTTSSFLGPREQPTPLLLLLFFGPNSSLPSNRKLPNSSESPHPGGGCGQPPGRPASAGLPHLPLPELRFPPRRCGSAGRGPHLPRAGREEARGRRVSLTGAKPALGPVLLQDALRPSQTRG